MNTAETIRRLAPKADPQFAATFGAAIDDMAPLAGLSGVTALSGFLAHAHHESAGFTRFEENMRYSARRLMQVWPRRFPTLESAVPFAFEPEKLANHVYANRMGNGPAISGDGWRFRGSGPFQHTGAAEHRRVYAAAGVTGEQLRDPKAGAAGARAAISYCVDRRMIAPLRNGDMRASTRLLNGGLIGLEDRMVLQRRYAALLAGHARPAEMTRAESVTRDRRAAGGALAGAGASGGSTIAIPKTPASEPGRAAEAASTAGWPLVIGLVGLTLLLGYAAGRLIRRAMATGAALDREEAEAREARIKAAEAAGKEKTA